ncbi:hypothetical protein NA56DRAFT_699051 [Hyaloscypha hepaticicola]|uniref:Uncharacterized protein n=1 Tax=Hyaloscypha hepaticicola TaxID=2082293 RepID=A0A2J6QI79_9HELO|nr:hypothetical protein NA56DRAFT_699051 [Hyaloscypha hepaticicola]
MARISRSHYNQAIPLQPLSNATLLHSGLTSCMCDANAGTYIYTDTITSSNGGNRDCKPPAKKRTIFVWQCCQCGQSNINIQIEDCPQCSNPRCAYCPTTKVQIRPAGFAESGGEDTEGTSEAVLEEEDVAAVYTCTGHACIFRYQCSSTSPPLDLYLRDENADTIDVKL